MSDEASEDALPQEREPLNGATDSSQCATSITQLRKECHQLFSLETDLQQRRAALFLCVFQLLDAGEEAVDIDRKCQKGIGRSPLTVLTDISTEGDAKERITPLNIFPDGEVSSTKAEFPLTAKKQQSNSEIKLHSFWSAWPESSVSLGFIEDFARSRAFHEGCLRRHKLDEVRFAPFLHPQGNFRSCWAIASLMFILFDFTAVPTKVFQLAEAVEDGLRLVEFVAAIFWAIDVLLNFRTGYFAGTILITNQKDIAKRYVKSWLFVDLFLVATDVLSFFEDAIFGNSVLRASRSLRIMRTFRVVRVAKVQIFLFNLEDSIGGHATRILITLLKLVLFLVLAIHLCTCGWYFMGKVEDKGWVNYRLRDGENVPPAEDDLVFWYSMSCRWVLAQVNGRTDIDPKRTKLEVAYICAVAVIFPVVVMSIFVSTVTKIVLDLAAISGNVTRTRESTNLYLVTHNIRPALANHVRRHVAMGLVHEQNQEKWQHEHELVSFLPERLRKTLLSEVRFPIVKEHPLFRQLNKRTPPSSQHILANACFLQEPKRGETIFAKGDITAQMLFIIGGDLQYGNYAVSGQTCFFDIDQQTQGSDPFASRMEKVYEGMWICEPALWLDKWSNQGNLVAYSTSSLLTIEQDLLISVIEESSDEAHRMASSYAERYANELMSRAANGRLSDIVEVLVW